MESHSLDKLSLAGKIGVVTGGTQGLGEAVAHVFADRGAAGLVICGRNQTNGARVKAALEAKGAKTVYVPADLAKIEDCRAVIAAADRTFGRVDALVKDQLTRATVREALDGVRDLERLAGKAATQRATPRELRALGDSLESAHRAGGIAGAFRRAGEQVQARSLGGHGVERLRRVPEQSLKGTLGGSATSIGSVGALSNPAVVAALENQAIDGAVESAMRGAATGFEKAAK